MTRDRSFENRKLRDSIDCNVVLPIKTQKAGGTQGNEKQLFYESYIFTVKVLIFWNLNREIMALISSQIQVEQLAIICNDNNDAPTSIPIDSLNQETSGKSRDMIASSTLFDSIFCGEYCSVNVLLILVFGL